MKTLKELRQQSKLTLKEVSKYTHISMSYLSKFENGKSNMEYNSEYYNQLRNFYGEDFIIERCLTPKQSKELLNKIDELSYENDVLKNKLNLLEEELQRIITIFDPKGCETDGKEH